MWITLHFNWEASDTKGSVYSGRGRVKVMSAITPEEAKENMVRLVQTLHPDTEISIFNIREGTQWTVVED